MELKCDIKPVAKSVQQPSLEVKPGTQICKKVSGHIYKLGIKNRRVTNTKNKGHAFLILTNGECDQQYGGYESPFKRF